MGKNPGVPEEGASTEPMVEEGARNVPVVETLEPVPDTVRERTTGEEAPERTTGMRLASERTPPKKRSKKLCKEGDTSDASTCCSGELEIDRDGLELGHGGDMGPPQAPAGRLTRSIRRAAGKKEELVMLVPEPPNPRRATNKKVGESGNEGDESDTSSRPTRQQQRDAEKAAREAVNRGVDLQDIGGTHGSSRRVGRGSSAADGL